MMDNLFYSSVILNSTETTYRREHVGTTFYSSVILNSTETELPFRILPVAFYSSVILNSTETYEVADDTMYCFTVVLY